VDEEHFLVNLLMMQVEEVPELAGNIVLAQYSTQLMDQ
jgi:hypothetical protein